MELSLHNNQPDTVKDVKKVVFYATLMEHVCNAFQTINSQVMVNAFVVLENSQPQQDNVQPVPVQNVLHAKTQPFVLPVLMDMFYNKVNAYLPVVKDITVMALIV